MTSATLSLLQGPGPETAAAWPAWFPEVALWLAGLGLFVLAVVALGLWAAVRRLRQLGEETARLATLEELDRKLGRLVADRDDLDLRRLEHLLIELRDTQARLGDVLLRLAERGLEAAPSDPTAVVPLESLGERVTNRFLAMGFREVEIVTPNEELARLAREDGEVQVEARRDGVLHKGRARVRSGRVADVEMDPTYSIFP